MIKVVQFIHGLSMGGAETLVKDYCLYLNKNKFDLTLLCLEHINSPYEIILEHNGIKIIYIDDYIHQHKLSKNNLLCRAQRLCLRYYYTISTLRKLKPDIVHSHLPVNFYLWLAHFPHTTRIFHTVHSEPYRYWGDNAPMLYKIDRWSLRRLIRNYDTTFIALHEKMLKEIREIYNVNNTVILNNGIDFSNYDNLKSKDSMRKELNIRDDAYVIGHVGRFIDIKNHDFLLDIFEEVIKKVGNAVLLLIGTGETKKHILDRVSKENIQDKVIFLENRTDVANLMGAMDIFVFPSKLEGLPVTLVEAQKVGLPCIISDNITEKVVVSNLVKRVSISDSALKWAELVTNTNKLKPKYQNISRWDIRNVVCTLEDLYLGNGSKKNESNKYNHI